jgi:hypothetical protein
MSDSSAVAVSGAGVVPGGRSGSGGFDIYREEYQLRREPLEIPERAMDVSTWGPMVDYSSSSRRCPRLVDILFPRPNDNLLTEYESLNLPFMWASNIIGNLFIVHWRGIRGLLLDLTRLRARQLQAHIKQIARELEESSRAFATYMAAVNEALGPEEIVSVPHLGSAEFVRHHTITETLSKGLYDASHMLNIILKIQL